MPGKTQGVFVGRIERSVMLLAVHGFMLWYTCDTTPVRSEAVAEGETGWRNRGEGSVEG